MFLIIRGGNNINNNTYVNVIIIFTQLKREIVIQCPFNRKETILQGLTENKQLGLVQNQPDMQQIQVLVNFPPQPLSRTLRKMKITYQTQMGTQLLCCHRDQHLKAKKMVVGFRRRRPIPAPHSG